MFIELGKKIIPELREEREVLSPAKASSEIILRLFPGLKAWATFKRPLAPTKRPLSRSATAPMSDALPRRVVGPLPDHFTLNNHSATNTP